MLGDIFTLVATLLKVLSTHIKVFDIRFNLQLNIRFLGQPKSTT